MTTSFLHTQATRRSGSSETKPPKSAAQLIDWHALRMADRACCCPARPAVIAVMPSTASRPHPTDLLLCGHHYRVSRQALAAAGAAVFSPDGRPVDAGLSMWSANSPVAAMAAGPPGTHPRIMPAGPLKQTSQPVGCADTVAPHRARAPQGLRSRPRRRIGP